MGSSGGLTYSTMRRSGYDFRIVGLVVAFGQHGSVLDGEIDFQQGEESSDNNEVAEFDHATVHPNQSTDVAAVECDRWDTRHWIVEFEDQVDVLNPEKEYQHCGGEHQESAEVFVNSCGKDLVGINVGEKEDGGTDYEVSVLPRKQLVGFEGWPLAGVAIYVIITRVPPVFLLGIVGDDNDQIGEGQDGHPYPEGTETNRYHC